MQIRGKRFTVLGAGRSGIAAAKLLRRRKAKVFLSDSSQPKGPEVVETLLREIGPEFELGENTHRVLEADTIVVSPGVPLNIPILLLARQQNIPIISEIELAASICEAPIIAITGTNGKTTTTTLIGEIFKQAGWNTFLAGNIGVAFSDIVEEASRGGEKTVVVLEVSSFQLDTIDTFRPKVSLLLNITPDHLDRYASFESYIQSKFRVVENQRGHDTFIFSFDDDIVRKFAETVSIRTAGFSLNAPQTQGCWLDEGVVKLRLGREKADLIPASEIGIPGPHNLRNAMAASLAAKAMGVELDSIRETLRSFHGVEHRVEFVCEIGGVRYINDSKATNVDSVYYALGSFAEPIILIAGGKDKGNDYAQIEALVRKQVKRIIAVGDGAEKLIKYFTGIVPIENAGHSMEEAVKRATASAEPGDVVLLSPACASFDMFDNYEHRGKVFKELVRAMK